MMEVPNNAKPEELMDFKKFAQSVKGLIYGEDKVFIEGQFKESGGKEVILGDDFEANKVWKSGEKVDAELIYRIYLEWFNRTLRRGEKERIFVSAKLIQKTDLCTFCQERFTPDEEENHIGGKCSKPSQLTENSIGGKK